MPGGQAAAPGPESHSASPVGSTKRTATSEKPAKKLRRPSSQKAGAKRTLIIGLVSSGVGGNAAWGHCPAWGAAPRHVIGCYAIVPGKLLRWPDTTSLPHTHTMSTRIEHDTFGPVQVPAARLW